MARYIRLSGIASLVIVENDHEIEDLLAHPALTREFKIRGPVLNRMIVGALLRQFLVDGRIILSMRPRHDPERMEGQASLQQKLDNLGAQKSWDIEALRAAAAYVRAGDGRNQANAALAYAMAYPFLDRQPGNEQDGFDVGSYRRLFRAYRALSRSRRPFSLRGMLTRLTGGIRRNHKKLLAATNHDEYGLHALSIALDNGTEILENMRLAYEDALLRRKKHMPFRWVAIRTAPETVIRQVTKDYALPHIDDRIPENSLIIFRMRDALRSDSFSGFEFAARQWSACPAHHYLLSFFEAVWEVAQNDELSMAAPSSQNPAQFAHQSYGATS